MREENMAESERAPRPGAFRAPEPGGSAQSWIDRLYRTYRQELTAFAVRKVGQGPPDPEDVVQHTFRQIAAMADPAAIVNIRAFLYRSAANYIISFRRREKVRRRHAGQASGLGDIFGESDGLDPERVLLGRERIMAVSALIRRLPRRQRRLLLLNRVEGVSFAELARRYDVSEATVRREVKKALEALTAYAPDRPVQEENKRRSR
ncbi:MAG: sigma-70 family RNA polymerase sigma factor [Pseudomonadota bacterium]